MTHWHYAHTDADGITRLRHNDKRIVRVGETLTVSGPLQLHNRGLHASRSVIAPLEWQPSSPCLCLVGLAEIHAACDGYAVARRRTVIAMLSRADTDELLFEIAAYCRAQVAHLDTSDLLRQVRHYGDIDGNARDAAWLSSALAQAALSHAAYHDTTRHAAYEDYYHAPTVAAKVAAADALIAQEQFAERIALQRMGIPPTD